MLKNIRKQLEYIKSKLSGLHKRKDTILIARDGLLKRCEGIVTKGEIYVKVLAANLDPGRVKISEVVKPRHFITISPDASYKEAAEIMINNNIRRLPVVEDDVLVGIITSEDLLQCVS